MTMSVSDPAPTPLGEVIKGDSDYRDFRPLHLDNGITVLLVRDPQSRHLAASVSVHAGASSDPRTLPGLAHFCEHMCFLGSEAYPEEDGYKRYLASRGGRSNASTSMSHTTYQFDVLAEHGEGALDMFSHFFIGPLFTKSGTRREVNAVDSENSKNLVSDARRRLQVLKSLMDEGHHYSKFSTGNRITLPACADESDVDESHPLHGTLKELHGEYDSSDAAEFVRAALLAFHERHYWPSNMSAVVVGPQSLDELESWVVPRLGRIPDRRNEGGGDDMEDSKSDDDGRWLATRRAAAQIVRGSAEDAPPVSVAAAGAVEHRSPFRPELQGGAWPVVVTTKPLQSVRKLVLHFPLPPTWHAPDRSPTSLLSHLFGHEGPGSPFARLQDAGWISSLSAGNRISGPDHALFQIAVNLTEEGEGRWRDVAKVIFDYGKLVCRAAEESLSGRAADGNTCDGEDELGRIWGEIAALDRMRFHQTSPGAAYAFAPSVAQSISRHGTETCLSAGSLLGTLPLEEALNFCRRIVPANCLIERCSDAAWEEMEGTYSTDEGLEGRQSVGGFAFGKRAERWYGVDYYVSPVNEDDVRRWEAAPGDTALRLPRPNRYIPRTLELCEDLPEEARRPRIEKPIDPPKLVVNEPNERLWWRLDDRYALPKASVTILLRTATAENKLQKPHDGTDRRWNYDPRTSLASNFLTRMFTDSLLQDTYDAYLAGLGWSLSRSSSGFTLTCSGYSDRLSDLALRLLADFCRVGNPTFLKESHFLSTKDKVVRGLKGYFESSRADSLALYYRDLLMSSRGEGIEKNLELAEAMTLADVTRQHEEIWADQNMVTEILYTGNVAQKEARDFFFKVKDVIQSTRSNTINGIDAEGRAGSGWVPGPLERRLPPGEDLELHWQSENPKEENGAVIFTYQSQVEGFKGKSLSSKESLQQSAAIRLLCKMIKEPCFNELRTKQQLGYIVSSYYDVNYSTRQSQLDSDSSAAAVAPSQQAPLITAIDSMVLYVLSRREKPIEVANRIDDFLVNFRSQLEEMTSAEVQNYADSLAKALTKPVRKLGDEASNHMSKIRRYAPETLVEGSTFSAQDLPWDNPEVLASAVRKLDRDIILQVYDSLVLRKDRSRIVSFVYGKTFPMELGEELAKSWAGGKFSASSMADLMSKRKSLITFDPAHKYPKEMNMLGRFWRTAGKNKTASRYALVAAAAVGVGVCGALALRGRGNGKATK